MHLLTSLTKSALSGLKIMGAGLKLVGDNDLLFVLGSSLLNGSIEAQTVDCVIRRENPKLRIAPREVPAQIPNRVLQDRILPGAQTKCRAPVMLATPASPEGVYIVVDHSIRGVVQLHGDDPVSPHDAELDPLSRHRDGAAAGTGRLMRGGSVAEGDGGPATRPPTARDRLLVGHRCYERGARPSPSSKCVSLPRTSPSSSRRARSWTRSMSRRARLKNP
jgi:hypothetical protein